MSETVYACLAVGIALRIGSNEARALGGGAPRKSKQRRGLAALFSRKAKP